MQNNNNNNVLSLGQQKIKLLDIASNLDINIFAVVCSIYIGLMLTIHVFDQIQSKFNKGYTIT